MRLEEPLLNKGFYIFIDNYYTCPALCERLVSEVTMFTSKVLPNRQGMPKDLKERKLKTGEKAFRRKKTVGHPKMER